MPGLPTAECTNDSMLVKLEPPPSTVGSSSFGKIYAKGYADYAICTVKNSNSIQIPYGMCGMKERRQVNKRVSCATFAKGFNHNLRFYDYENYLKYGRTFNFSD